MGHIVAKDKTTPCRISELKVRELNVGQCVFDCNVLLGSMRQCLVIPNWTRLLRSPLLYVVDLERYMEHYQLGQTI